MYPSALNTYKYRNVKYHSYFIQQTAQFQTLSVLVAAKNLEVDVEKSKNIESKIIPIFLKEISNPA